MVPFKLCEGHISGALLEIANMGRIAAQKLPMELEQFYKSLKSLNCSAKWNWEKLIETLQDGSRNGSAFLGMCEAGIFHIMYSKPAHKDSSILCKKLHASDFNLMHSVGICYSLHLLSGAVSNRTDKFKNSLEQLVSTLLDALIAALKVSDFNETVLQPLASLQNAKVSLLPRLLPINETAVKNVLDLALCRIYIISSTLRGIFECGFASALPICLPFLSSVISAAFSVNICDARRSSFALISCFKHLLHTFSVISQSCGVNISPALPCLITSLVYQLEWSSSFARLHSSKESLSYKLAVYRCTSSLLDASAHVVSSALCRLVHRLISEVCVDISYPAKENLAQILLANGDLAVFELRVCCTVASIRLLEVLFVNHRFIISHSLPENFDGSTDFSSPVKCNYKLKHVLLLLSSELNCLASRLVILLNKQTRLSPVEQILIRPHFLLPFITAAAATVDYGFLFSKSDPLCELTRALLAHRDSALRLVAERCFKHMVNVFRPETQFANFGFSEKSLTSSFTQTETTGYSAQYDRANGIASNTPVTGALSEPASVAEQSVSQRAATIAPVISEFPKLVGPIEVNEILEEDGRAPILIKTTEPPRQSNKRGKRVRFEESSPESMKKPRPGIKNISLAKPVYPPPAPEKSDEDMLSLEDALCTFDDTLI